MSRYFSRPATVSQKEIVRSAWWESDPLLPSLTVPDFVAIETGLLDAHGDPIMRAPNPMGFGRDGEW